MKILFLGDIVGRSGREAVKEHLPTLKEKLEPDFIIANVDNAASGRGVTQKVAQEIIGYGVDCLTGGDHIWDQREMVCGVENIAELVRPANLPAGTPGRGAYTTSVNGQKITVLHLGGTVFMSHHFDSPFDYVEAFLKQNKIGKGAHIFIDFHAEATSEKMGLAHFVDGRVSALVGSHTHVPTADAQVFVKGTAFQCDAGMCGDYNSVIGVKPEAPIQNFTRKVAKERMTPAEGEATLCGTFVETDDNTGLALNVRPIRVGGRLREQL